MSRRTEYFPLRGGINTSDPALSVAPGELIDCRNYEHALKQGYKRAQGYERYDGQQSPADESYWILDITSGQNEPSSGDVVTGGASLATGIYVDSAVSSGSWAGNDAVGYLVLRSVSGVFQDAETLTITGPTTVGTADGTASIRGASTDALDSTYLAAAMEAARSDIAAVPGSGRIRGVWSYNDVRYAFRDNAGATAGAMYKSTVTGWSLVDLGGEVAFDTGTTEIAVGDTVTGASSGATAVITRVVVQSGSWSTNDAAGYLHFTTHTLTFSSGENLQVSAATRAVSTAVGSDNALPLAGQYEFINYNFYGSTGTFDMFGVNGVGKGFSFDGTDFYFIHTKMTVDAPKHVVAHKKHLFFSFALGSIQHSSIGEPFIWSPITGAAEIAVGDECTGMIVLPGQSLGLFCRNSRFVLQGTSTADWNLIAHNETAGAVEWTIQDMGYPIYLDDPGLAQFNQSDEFGDFVANTLSLKFQDVIESYKQKLLTTVRVRTKSQYRMFFNDNVVLVVTMDNRRLLGATLFEYDDPIYCACSAEDSSGNEILFGGSDDGWVYQLDKGNNFDGDDIDAWLRMVFANFKSPEYRKRFFKMVLELDASSELDMAFLAEYAYGDTYYPQDNQGDAVSVLGGGGYWDADTNWERFFWDAPPVSSAFGYLSGVGENISLFTRTVGKYNEVHTLQGLIFHLSNHGVRR